jgi:hypothetical protein
LPRDERLWSNFGHDAVIDIDEHRSTKCCNGCGCVLAKLYTDGHSQFSERKYDKKLNKHTVNIAQGGTSLPPRPLQDRRIEGLVQCTSTAERCPLFGGCKIDRDGNAARSIGDAFLCWLQMIPPPSFMHHGLHPEDVTPSSINIHDGSLPIIRWIKERFPPDILRSMISIALSTLDKTELLGEMFKAFVRGYGVPQELIEALIALFGPVFWGSNDDDDDNSGAAASGGGGGGDGGGGGGGDHPSSKSTHPSTTNIPPSDADDADMEQGKNNNNESSQPNLFLRQLLLFFATYSYAILLLLLFIICYFDYSPRVNQVGIEATEPLERDQQQTS